MSPPFTVVHLITQLEWGGAQENTLDTCAGLDPNRFEVVLLHGPGGKLDGRAARAHHRSRTVESLVRPISPRLDLRALGELTRQIRGELERHTARGGARSHFIVHTHSSKAGILGRWAAWRAGARNIVHGIHGFGFHEGQAWTKYQLFLNAERGAARVTRAFAGVSETNLAEARAKGIIGPRHEVRLVRSGMDLKPFLHAATRGEARRELGLPLDAELVVSIANLKPQKDPLTMVRAFARVARERAQAHLLYAGDGDLRPEVEREISKLGLGTRIRLLGWRDDVPRLIAAADVVALSSLFEGLPRSAVQAVAGGRTFVGTRVDGTPEIIRDGENGFLVRSRDPSALARALLEGLEKRPTDPEDRVRVQDWSTERMVEAQERLYQHLADR